MKLKTVIFVTLFSFLAMGCGSEIKCSSDDVVRTVSELISEDFAYGIKFSPSEKQIQEIHNNRVYTYTAIRKVAMDESTGAVGCAADYTITFKNEGKTGGKRTVHYVASPTEEGTTYVQLYEG